MSTAYLFYKSLIYKSIKTKNKLKKYFYSKTQQKYLFILSPPYSGSTLLHEILSTSSFISPNNTFDTREGQQLPELKDKMFVKGRFESDFKVDWTYAHSVWHKYWDPSYPIFLDKSPANIVRAKEIEQHFQPSFFLLLVRNPYAQCESLIRKNSWDTTRSANFAIQCLKHQKKNHQQLQNTALFKYEEITNNQEKVRNLIRALLPEVSDLQFDRKFKAHNFQNKSLKPTNLNAQKIEAFSAAQIEEMNRIFKQEESLLNYFGFELIA